MAKSDAKISPAVPQLPAAGARKGPPIAIYTVTANDRDLIKRFAANFVFVDLVVVADRGSIDGTREELRRLGAQIIDATGLGPDAARAAALGAIDPGYICVALEPTDLLQGDWRDAVNARWSETSRVGLHDVTWFHGAGTRGWSDLILDRVHARDAAPVADNAIGSVGAESVYLGGVAIEHRPHPRALSAGGLCSPGADGLQQGAALFLRGQLASAAAALRRHLAAVPDPASRLHAWRILAAALRLYGDRPAATSALRVAAVEHPDCRELLADTTTLFHENADWEECYAAARAATAMPWMGRLPSTGLRSSHNGPFDLGAIAAYKTGRFAEALRLGHGAIAREPDNERIRGNARFYREAAVREGVLSCPAADRLRLILVSGPWSGGTSAVAGMLARLGARGLGPYKGTSDPRTPNSYESLAFARAIDAGVEVAEASVHRADTAETSRRLIELKEDMAWGTFTMPEEDKAAPFFAKYPASALLLDEIAAVFELQIVAVRRPLEEIQKTCVRRGWPALFGAAGAQIINAALGTPAAGQLLVMDIDYVSVLADPVAAATRLAGLVGDVSQQRIEDAAAFVRSQGRGG